MENQHSAAGSSEVAAVRVFAGFFSYVFHPLFITTYVTAFLLYVHPYAFAGLEPKLKMFRMASVIVSTLFLPGLAVLLARQLDFVKSIYLHTQRDRIIPYIISLTFYFWA
ncbi:MAG TPA: hypothetical protein VD996_00820, partial [Chitinophagaceae bacterium]|nr:hypothetical protein [Chitinophagaceae bacterium]